jgi:hypothetical protein
MSISAVRTAAAVALWMAHHQGWHVLPLHPGTKKPLGGCRACGKDGDGHRAAGCLCLARGDGALCHGVWAATNDPDIVAFWARRERTRVWGLHAGASGLLAVDLDTRGGIPPARPLTGLDWPADTPAPIDGIDVYGGLAGLHGAGFDIDRTLSTQTPSGGMHLIYAAEPGRWKSSAGTMRADGTLPASCVGWQVDIKSHAGIVVIPGSITDAGTYSRVSSTVDAMPLPSWLTAVLVRTGHDRHATPSPVTPPRPVTVAPADGSRQARYAAGALRSACVELAAMEPDSGRNNKLFRTASKLAWMVGQGWIDRAQVEQALADAAQQCRLPQGEITYALASGFRTPRRPELPRSVA